MPRSIDVLTSPSAPAWPTLLIALKSPLPSPKVMVPKQSFETSRPVLPSVAYCIAFSFYRSLLPVADQNVAARRRELWTIFLDAGQIGEIAVILHLATQTLQVPLSCLCLLS